MHRPRGFVFGTRWGGAGRSRIGHIVLVDRVADTDYAVVALLASRSAGAYLADVRDVTTSGHGSGVQFKPHWNLKPTPWKLAVSVGVDAAYPSAVFLLRTAAQTPGSHLALFDADVLRRKYLENKKHDDARWRTMRIWAAGSDITAAPEKAKELYANTEDFFDLFRKTEARDCLGGAVS